MANINNWEKDLDKIIKNKKDILFDDKKALIMFAHVVINKLSIDARIEKLKFSINENSVKKFVIENEAAQELGDLSGVICYDAIDDTTKYRVYLDFKTSKTNMIFAYALYKTELNDALDFIWYEFDTNSRTWCDNPVELLEIEELNEVDKCIE